MTAVAGGCIRAGRMGRRNFLITTGSSAAFLNTDLFSFASSLFAAESGSASRPLVHAVFFGDDVERYWMGWPGAAYDLKARKDDCIRAMSGSAEKLGVQLNIEPKPVQDSQGVSSLLEKCGQSAPDGVILIMLTQEPRKWSFASEFLAKRGDIPAVVFSPFGTSFLGNMKKITDYPKTFAASTQHIAWPASGIRMLNAIRQMKETRICVLQGDTTEDIRLETVGTTLHYIPSTRFQEEFAKVDLTDEMRAIADYYRKNAVKIVEPNEKDILDAAKNYVVCRRIMAAENCHGFSIDCLPMVASRIVPPPCVALSRLNDEGMVGGCQADWPAAISLRLTHLLLDKPGFMQNISVNTVNNTLLASHCTCPTKLKGYDQQPEPFILRSHTESDKGVSMQVIWPVGQEITIMKFSHGRIVRKPQPATPEYAPDSTIMLGSGRIVENIDSPPSGCCRTAMEVKLDNVADILDLKYIHHQVFTYGNHVNEFKAYARLSGLNIVSI